ncbi:MAG: hypothetical protein AAF567_05460 [Actinomycetota bacterium]
MVSPKKRRNSNSRSEKRASQRYTPPADPATLEPEVRATIPRPPSSCAPYHFYWCDGHNDWHHHDEFVVTAIERTLQQQQQQPPS